LPKSWRQTLQNPIPLSLPLEVAFPKQLPKRNLEAIAKLYADLAARSGLGKLLELEGFDHSKLSQAWPVLDRLVVRITRWQTLLTICHRSYVARIRG
jgi:hypothetical protein